MNNPYRLSGIVLAVAGALTAPVFYFIVGSVPLTAVSFSAVITGFTCIVLANARPYISPEACQTLLKTGMENTAALLEELGLRARAVYVPSGWRGGSAQALVPLNGSGDLHRFKEKLPGRLIVRCGPGEDDMAIAVTTAGSVNLDLLPRKPGPSPEEIESALGYLLTGVLDIAGGVSVYLADSQVRVEVNGARMMEENVWYYRCLGSPLASIVTTVVSEALDKPVRILEETARKGKVSLRLEVLS